MVYDIYPPSNQPARKRNRKPTSRKLEMVRCEHRSADVKGVLHRDEYYDSSIIRPAERPETSPELIRDCLARVEIELSHGNEPGAVAAIRYAFANGLCKQEPHDPRDLPNDEPLASTSLGGGPDHHDNGMSVRIVEMLERYDIRTVGDVRRLGVEGLRRIPFIADKGCQLIARAVGLEGCQGSK